MSETMIDTGVLVVETCPTCGVRHAFPGSLQEKMLQHRGPTGRSVYCPNGHNWCYTGKSDAEREREQRERAERERDMARRRADYHENRADHEARRAVALKGVVTRTKKRIAAGKCPCCKERFPDLAAHMQHQHPGYGADPA